MVSKVIKKVKTMAEDILSSLMSMSQKKVICTGGSGFIGQHVMKELGARGINCDLKVGKDLYSDTFEEEAKECSAIIHLAVDPVKNETNSDFEKMMRILNVANRNNLKVVFASSAAVYADNDQNTKREYDAVGPLSAYAQAKLESEYLCMAYARKVPITILRYFNVYGPGQNSEYVGVITAFLEGIKYGEVTINGTGDQVRDFIHVDDVAKITVAALDPKWSDATVNVGTGKPTTVNDLYKMFVKLSGKYLKANYDYTARSGIYRSCADNTSLRTLWGQPNTDLENNLKEMIAAKYGN